MAQYGRMFTVNQQHRHLHSWAAGHIEDHSESLEEPSCSDEQRVLAAHEGRVWRSAWRMMQRDTNAAVHYK